MKRTVEVEAVDLITLRLTARKALLLMDKGSEAYIELKDALNRVALAARFGKKGK